MYVEPITAQETTAAAAWVRAVIHKPWHPGAHGPDAFDCWGLTRATMRHLAGFDLPDIRFAAPDLRRVMELIRSHEERDEWAPVDQPRHLDIVLMSHARTAHHVGVWLAVDGGVVLHTTEQRNRKDDSLNLTRPGVACQTLLALRLDGWMKFQFMRRKAGAA